MKRKLFLYRYILVGIWGLFTCSLTGWWIYFGLEQTHRLMELEGSQGSTLVRYQKMLLWEGGFLILFLIGGALSIAYLMYREMRERRRIQEFFAAFSHELKTPLSSMLLTAEILKERYPDSRDASFVEKFLGDLNTFSQRLENSLFLANLDTRNYFIETIALRDVVESVKNQFPQITIECKGDCSLRVDRRALESILSNLIGNASLHGKASTVVISVEKASSSTVRFSIIDNGQGFTGEKSKIAKLFHRHYGGSGTGLGLYLVSQLVKEMKGSFEVLSLQSGFGVSVTLPGAAV